MRAALHNLAGLDHHDHVCMRRVLKNCVLDSEQHQHEHTSFLDGGQTVGNHKHGAVLRQPVEGFLNQVFAFSIECTTHSHMVDESFQ